MEPLITHHCRFFAPYILWIIFTPFCSAQIDLGGDNLSDLWQLHYSATNLASDSDPDGDGVSTSEEELAGTDPNDPTSYFRVSDTTENNGLFTLNWEAYKGKQYTVETSNDLSTWTPTEPIISAGGIESVDIPASSTPSQYFFRINVNDVDSDGDGLTDYEENLLGFDATSKNSTGTISGGDFGAAVTRVSSGQPFSLGGRQVTGMRPTPEAASRFLTMATLGANREEISRVASMGYDAWIDSQFTQPAGLILPEMQAWVAAGQNVFDNRKRHAWWRQALTSEDILRQRVAFAFSQIWVISDRQLVNSSLGMGTYYDMLLENSFGNIRDILFDVSMSPAMGAYLSHLKNRKPNPAANRFSDENYAREVMQLFSIGLFELNQDGTRKKTPEGDDIPTYNNETITNFARVFTGLTFAVNGTPSSDDFYFSGQRNFFEPMEIFEGEHDTDAKTLLNNTTLPAFADAPGRTGIDDINDAITNIFEHPNIGPFLGRILIQRFVKSNPSPAYIARVAAAFENNGLGTRGDMRAILKAIFLDPEAIVPPPPSDLESGRLREPFVRYTRLLRTFDATSANGTFQNSEWNTNESLSQLWFSAPSVFNFFSPDHRPTGILSNAGLDAPEFQIHTSVTAVTSQNFYRRVILQGAIEGASASNQIYLNLEDELLLANNPEALVDRLDLLLTYGSLSSPARQTIINTISQFPTGNPMARVQTAIRLIIFSPDFSIFR